jgi:hypothetical protein
MVFAMAAAEAGAGERAPDRTRPAFADRSPVDLLRIRKRPSAALVLGAIPAAQPTAASKSLEESMAWESMAVRQEQKTRAAPLRATGALEAVETAEPIEVV